MTRHLMVLCLCLLTLGFAAQAQTTEKPPAYKQYPVIPAFPLTLVNGQTITKNDLKKNVQTLVFIFSVECDHCKHMTEEVEKNIDKFKNTQIVMITPFQPERMKEYYDTYHIKNYPNITMASEATRQIMYFYDLHYFPGLYIYDKKGKFVKGWEGTAKLDSLTAYLK